jgi:predicted nucleic acid-binding protein
LEKSSYILNKQVKFPLVHLLKKSCNSFLRDYSPPNNKRYAEASKKAMKQRSYVYEVNEEIAVDSAKIKHEKKWGLGDSIIYATAKREDAKVLTGDPHFRGLKDVIFLEKEKI